MFIHSLFSVPIHHHFPLYYSPEAVRFKNCQEAHFRRPHFLEATLALVWEIHRVHGPLRCRGIAYQYSVNATIGDLSAQSNMDGGERNNGGGAGRGAGEWAAV